MNKKKVVSYHPAWESQFTWIEKDKTQTVDFVMCAQYPFE